ncbi:hypothetical protein M2164_001480 [Streptomyces sp. SAI-208]|uniref:hypothetical protein n=1 Tax=unclassified Streptomyces TaxID=2593676 RepID=UPI0024749FC2|nr:MULTISPECIES: hypothetical protein [unclassified Streptomyces]MDH6515000.1 hypothetical protein [Streptomyces sp. SAI-090]MDH6547215.1 hypothetical protein [Streptomyces sp. SAI-041]MDH6566294.1 hypothetical protein [Streptomyces sp. SAI-117]MDH6588766.1 hypothetical protein [Streptomyces sp. SAI-133]MDH6605845.1 hypothetical protein [Streptomyces sp. SAI-208]
MISGYVIGESLRTGAVFAPHGLRLRKVSRVEVAGASGGQPPVWTLVEWESDGEDIDALADALADALEPELGWYADFVAGDERVVVFAGKVFRHRRGDEAGRAAAVAYGRSVGTPARQLDWDE